MDKSKIPTARDLMEKVPTTFSPGMSLVDAIETLATMHVSAAPVVDDDACFLGMLTDRDCLRIVSVSAFHRPRGGKVADFLSPVKQAVELEMDLFRIAEIFLTTHFTVLPVLERGRLVGCINREGMLNGISFLTKVVEAEGVKVEAEASEAVVRPSSIGDMQQAFARLSKKQLVRRVGRRS
ncbi:MAG: CBS domain-containing protein [Thermoanaerobaculia bacterium]